MTEEKSFIKDLKEEMEERISDAHEDLAEFAEGAKEMYNELKIEETLEDASELIEDVGEIVDTVEDVVETVTPLVTRLIAWIKGWF